MSLSAQAEHYATLERMYHAAPVNQIYQPTLTVEQGSATVIMALQDSFHHAPIP